MLQEFEFETQRMKTGKQRSTPWGGTIRKAPEILHGEMVKLYKPTAAQGVLR